MPENPNYTHVHVIWSSIGLQSIILFWLNLIPIIKNFIACHERKEVENENNLLLQTYRCTLKKTMIEFVRERCKDCLHCIVYNFFLCTASTPHPTECHGRLRRRKDSSTMSSHRPDLSGSLSPLLMRQVTFFGELTLGGIWSTTDRNSKCVWWMLHSVKVVDAFHISKYHEACWTKYNNIIIYVFA